MKTKFYILLMICGFMLPLLSYGQYNTQYSCVSSCALSGGYNSAFGYNALASLTSGGFNTGIGYQALSTLVSNDGNTAVGYNALTATTGANNCGIGYSSLASNNSGNSNSALGFNSLFSNLSGGQNEAVGYDALNSNTTGSDNDAFGSQALFSNVGGSKNVSIGYQSLYSCPSGTDNAGIGFQALYYNTGSQNTAVGSGALYTNSTGQPNDAFGYQALYSNQSGDSDVAFGFQALYFYQSGINCSAFGNQALYNNTASHNDAFGRHTMYNNSSGNWNSAFGSYALDYNETGMKNDAFGNGALGYNESGNYNTAMGILAGRNSQGDNNTFMGFQAGVFNGPSGGNGGNENTCLGSYAYLGLGLTNATAIGFESYVNEDNALVLGSINGVNGASANTKVGIGVDAPAQTLEIGTGGTIRLDAMLSGYGYNSSSTTSNSNMVYADNTTGDLYALPTVDNSVLTTDASGVPSWEPGGPANLNYTYIGYGNSSNLLTGNANWIYDNSGNVQLKSGSFALDNTQLLRFDGIGDANWSISRNTGTGEYVTSNALILDIAGSSNEGLIIQNGSSNVDFEILGSNGAITFDKAYTFPVTDGGANQVLTTDGAGNVTWATPVISATAWQLTGNTNTTYIATLGQPTGSFIGTPYSYDYGIMFGINGQIAGRIEDGNSSNNSYYNTSLGYNALLTTTSNVTNNTAMGYEAGSHTDVGDNTFIGYEAGMSNQSCPTCTPYTGGNENTCLGSGADIASSGGFVGISDAAAIGYGAVATSDGMMMFGDHYISGLFTFLAGEFITSDGRFKRNITPNVVGLNFINKLKPVSYNYNVESYDEHVRGKKMNYSESELKKNEVIDAQVHSGFVAQDVEAAANSVGYNFDGIHTPQNEHDTYALAYSNFVVPLVKSVQELSAKSDTKDSVIGQQQQQLAEQGKQIEALQSANSTAQTQLQNQQMQLDQLSAMVSKLDIALSQCCTNYQSTTGSSVIGSNTTDVPLLNQNIPNPFSQNTIISCYIPTTAKGASISIFDLNGQLLKSFTIPTTGFNQITITGGTLAAGDYLYTLFVDGQKIDTKKMTLTH